MTTLRDLPVTLACRTLSLAFAPFSRRRATFGPPRSILVLKPCCIGDVLMATATVAELRKAFPTARISFGVGAWSRAVLEGNPRIDELIDCGTLGSGLRTRRSDYLDFVRGVKARGFDMCVVLDRSPLVSVMPLLAGIPRRIGLDSGGRGFSLTDKIPCRPDRNEVELYLDTVRALGICPRAPRLEFYPSAEDTKWARETLGQRACSEPAEGACPTIAIHPGGGENPGMRLPSKRWLPEGFAAIADKALETGARVALVGAPAERYLVDQVRALLHSHRAEDPARLIDLAGRTSLGQLGAALKECDLFIGNDAGPSHLAAAVGSPVVAIFGPSNPDLYRPYARSCIVLYKGLECSPCLAQGKAPPPCAHMRCMKEVTVSDVWQAVQTLFSGAQSGGA
ncbi:MAG: glycosyltransferase family 9 protein [Chloroflexi bacterium]|nr:glycosyltransferase family 9 protein [Chloroflexota bacterium]